MGGVDTDWLAKLAPAHAPPPPGWWPPAPGWWLLGLLVILAVAALIYWQTRPALRLRRLALRELATMDGTGNDESLAQELEHLLRRYAVARYGRDTVAALTGSKWLDFVATHGGSALAGAAGQGFLRAAYGGQVEALAAEQRSNWLTAARGFVRWRK